MKDLKSSKQRSFESLISFLEESILSGHIKPGERLSSERNLMKTFAVGRGTVREALRALEQKGLIGISKGVKGGAFVKKVDPEHVGETLLTLIRHQGIPINYLLEFQEAVEVNSAAYAAERATPEDMLLLKKSFQELEDLYKLGENGYRDFYQHERSLHRKLAIMSRNPLFEWLSITLATTVRSVTHLLLNDKKAAQEALEDWRQMIEAIENKRSTLLRSLTSTHLIKFKRIMEQKAKETRRF